MGSHIWPIAQLFPTISNSWWVARLELRYANDETAKVTFHTDQNCSTMAAGWILTGPLRDEMHRVYV